LKGRGRKRDHESHGIKGGKNPKKKEGGGDKGKKGNRRKVKNKKDL